MIGEPGSPRAGLSSYWVAQPAACLDMQMRMPIFSYFIVMGTVLIGLLFCVSNEIEPNSLPFKTSQMVGIPKPYKARPEVSQYTITNVNFAGLEVREISASSAATSADYPRPTSSPHADCLPALRSGRKVVLIQHVSFETLDFRCPALDISNITGQGSVGVGD